MLEHAETAMGMSVLGHYLDGWESIGAFLLAMLVSFVLGRPLIHWLQKAQMGQVVRSDGPQSHLSKKGTPTMGGVLILLAILISTLCFGDLSGSALWISLFVMLGAGLIGFLDDWLKKILKNSKGLPGKKKMLGLTLIALVAIGLMLHVENISPEIYWPIARTYWDLSGLWGLGFFIWGWFIIVGSANAVNLTDGLDGLVMMPVMLCALGLGLLAGIESHLAWALYFHLPYHPEFGNILIICGAVIGAGLGFLWFNTYPAKLFMGDVGALALGALLAVMALMMDQVIVFGIMGGIFVLEALSVMLQVGSYKLRKKRIFKMAPVHHHFELLGWHETTVTTRFWIVAIVLWVVGIWVGVI